MVKSSVIDFSEKINFDVLEKIINDAKIDDETRASLNKYKSKIVNGYVNVKYNYSQKSGVGRLYSEGPSMQSFWRPIRHTLANDYYYDIDMCNAGASILYQYCKKNNISTPMLRNYVRHRDDWLNNVINFHQVNRDAAKKLITAVLYLGSYNIVRAVNDSYNTPEKIANRNLKVENVKKLGREIKEISQKICDLNPDLVKIIKKDETKLNIKSSVICLRTHIIENKCLLAMNSYFENVGVKVGSLCFDGMLIEKSCFQDKMISKCQKYVYDATGYNITLMIKEMNEKLEYYSSNDVHISKYVTNDEEATKNLLQIINPKYFRYCNKKLYIFDETTGMYDTDETCLHYYLSKCADYLNIITHIDRDGKQTVKNYWRNSEMNDKIRNSLLLISKDDDFIRRTENTSLGYLLFNNGVYDMKTGKFNKKFDHNIVFHSRIPHDYNPRKQKYVDYAFEISFKRLLGDNYLPFLTALSRALAGDKMKMLFFAPGLPNSGKSSLVNMFLSVFPGFVSVFNAENLAVDSKNDSKDEAAKYRWALISRFARILFSNEIKMSKELDGNIIKKFSSGGDKIVARNLFQGEETFFPHFKLVCCMNDHPRISTCDKAVNNRLKYCEFEKEFVDIRDDGKYEPHQIPKDDNIDDIINSKKFINGFMHLVFDAYLNYISNPDDPKFLFSNETREKWVQNDQQDLVDIIKEKYIITKNTKDIISVSEMNEFKKKNKIMMSAQRFNNEMKTLGITQEKVDNQRVFTGIKRKPSDSMNNAEFI